MLTRGSLSRRNTSCTNLRHALLLSLLFPASLFARDEAAIREVEQGKRTEARADWWGFDEQDSTAFLQAALQSKARKIIIPNKGRPWITGPLQLRDDLDLVFEKGVELQALRGDFLGTNASLLAGRNRRKITITGNGAVLRMWKADYQQPPYKPAEWRHALSFHGAEDVTITGLDVRESGGDGIYLGTGAAGGCKRFVIRDVRCTGHHRQGISIISAEDLLIEDCIFNLTSGTAPQAGIDFEPNDPGERLKNCVLRRCTFNQNAAYGILFALGRMDATSEPVSILLEDCEVRGNRTAMLFAMRNPAGARGRVDFRRCVFAESTHEAVVLRTKTLPGPYLNFERCEFRQLAVPDKQGAPISIVSRGEQGDPLGGIRFDRCLVEDTVPRRPLAYDDIGGMRLQEVTGSITAHHGDAEQTYNLDDKLIDSWFPWTAQLRPFQRMEIEPHKLVPAVNGTRSDFPAFPATFRGDAHFVFRARKGEQTAFSLTAKVIGKKSSPQPVRVKLATPSGAVQTLAECLPGPAQHYVIAAAEDGVFHLTAQAGQQVVSIHSPSRAVSAIAPAGAFHLLGVTPPVYFQVPVGTREFAIRVAGDGGQEQARAIVRDATGKIVADEDRIARSRQILLTSPEPSQAAIWSLELARPAEAVIEDVHVVFDGIPPIIAPAPEALLVPAAKTR